VTHQHENEYLWALDPPPAQMVLAQYQIAFLRVLYGAVRATKNFAASYTTPGQPAKHRHHGKGNSPKLTCDPHNPVFSFHVVSPVEQKIILA
jgi:hypothetical protein